MSAIAFLSDSAFSGTMGPILEKNWQSVVGVSFGPAWVKGGETETFFTNPDFESSYIAFKNQVVIGVGELFFGVQRDLSSGLKGQLGVTVGGTTLIGLDGEIWLGADQRFDNYFYKYKVNQTRVSLRGKMIGNNVKVVQPYITGSIGVAANRASQFKVTPKIIAALPFEGFAAQTKTALTYNLGIGIQKALTEYLTAGIGYEFADLGKSGLGRMPFQTINTGLQLNHLYTHSAQINFSIIK